MTSPPQVGRAITPRALADLAADGLGALDLCVLLYMVGHCAFHVARVFDDDPFHVVVPGRPPEGMVGCFIYDGKRGDVCAALRCSVPSNVSRSVATLIRRSHVSRTHPLGLGTAFAFALQPKSFALEFDRAP